MSGVWWRDTPASSVKSELGHLFQFQAKWQVPRLWLAELFCNICLHAFTATVEPEQLPALETFPQMVANSGGADLRYLSLEDFERLYIDVGPQNYGWHQCRFPVAAKRIYEAGGVDCNAFWKAFLQSNEKMSDDQLAARLRADVYREVEDVLTAWPK